MSFRRKNKSEHPGVTVCLRKNGARYASWRDVRTNAKKYQSLSKLGFETAVQAREWLREKARQLHLEKRELALGLNTVTPEQKAVDERRKTRVPDVMERYFQDYAAKHGERAAREQRRRLRPWAEWIAKAHKGMLACGSISTVVLNDFRMNLITLKAHRPTSGPKGSVLVTDRALMASSVNNYRGATVAFLNWARRAGYLVLHRDEIGESLPKIKVRRHLKAAMTPDQLSMLINCAVSQDLERCLGSRTDKSAYYSGAQSELARQRYSPVAPMLLLLVLTGMRLQEALHLRWDAVDLPEERIIVRGDAATGWEVKTRTERQVPLSDSPLLRHLLTNLKLRSEGADYVIQGSNKKHPKPFDKRSWERLLLTTELGRFTPKDLRAAFASHMGAARGGPTPWELAHRLGHSIEVAGQHYMSPVKGQTGTTVEEWLGVKNAVTSALIRLGMALPDELQGGGIGGLAIAS